MATTPPRPLEPRSPRTRPRPGPCPDEPRPEENRRSDYVQIGGGWMACWVDRRLVGHRLGRCREGHVHTPLSARIPCESRRFVALGENARRSFDSFQRRGLGADGISPKRPRVPRQCGPQAAYRRLSCRFRPAQEPSLRRLHEPAEDLQALLQLVLVRCIREPEVGVSPTEDLAGNDQHALFDRPFHKFGCRQA
jgi:hypothetical protein